MPNLQHLPDFEVNMMKRGVHVQLPTIAPLSSNHAVPIIKTKNQTLLFLFNT